MLDTVRMLLLGAVGAIDLTEDKVRTLVDDLVRRGELAVDEARQFTAEWARGAAARRDDLDARLRVAVEEALGRYNVASHASVADLARRVAAIEEAIAQAAAPGDQS